MVPGEPGAGTSLGGSMFTPQLTARISPEGAQVPTPAPPSSSRTGSHRAQGLPKIPKPLTEPSTVLHPIAQSAPSTYVALRLHSTPIKCKECSIPLNPAGGYSTRETTSTRATLIHEELYGRWQEYANFPADFLLSGPWAPTALGSWALLSEDKVADSS